MAKNQMKTVANGLDKLKEAVKGLKLQLPKLRELPDLSGIGGTVEQKIAAVNQIQEDVANALKFLVSIEEQIEYYNDNRLARKIVVAETQADVDEMKGYLHDVLSLDDEIYRQAAAIAYLKTVLSGDFKSREEAEEVLRDLETRELLVKTGNDGPIMIGYQHYTMSQKFGMEVEDLAEISGVIAKFSRILKVLVYQQRQEKTKEVQQEVDIELAEALKGGNGKCLIEVPRESYLNREGQESYRGGGNLLVEFTSRELIPIVGIGSIEGAIKSMVAADVQLARYTLDWETPPGSGETAFKRVQSGVMDTLGFGSEEAEAYVNKMKSLWWLVRRAVKVLQSKEAAEKLKEEFRAKASITPVQCFGLNGSGHSFEGTVCLEFEGAFHQKAGQPSFYDLFFLAVFSKDGDKETVEVLEVPKHLQSVLGDFCGKKFPVEDNFSACPARLGRIFRGIRGQVEMAVEVAKE